MHPKKVRGVGAKTCDGCGIVRTNLVPNVGNPRAVVVIFMFRVD